MSKNDVDRSVATVSKKDVDRCVAALLKGNVLIITDGELTFQSGLHRNFFSERKEYI